ncbi:uncharacterized protein LOC128207536 [Mya arenaria]|nr:uncharacterized protein LOC128207536 [Mya arenaria]
MDYVVFLSAHTACNDRMNNYRLQPVRVESIDDTTQLNNKLCSAHSDPHIKTFDRDWTYDLHKPGSYLLYRNTEYRTEVQIKLDKCPTYSTFALHPYCIQALVARAGRDIFLINYGTHPEVNFKQCDDGVLHRKITKIGNKDYKIILPTGTKITVMQNRGSNGWEKFMEVNIYAGLPDVGRTDGLCGNCNGNPKDDPQHDSQPIYAQFFHISQTDLQKYTLTNTPEDLFNTANHNRVYGWDNRFRFCECDKNSWRFAIIGQLDKTEIKCKEEATTVCEEDSLKSTFPICTLARKKRSVDRYRSAKTRRVSSTVETRDHHIVLREANKYNESTARQECIRLMNTSVVQMCSNLKDFNISSFINSCVADTLITSSTVWSKIHLEAIKGTCIEHVRFNQPIPPDVLANATAPSDWFNETLNETETQNSTTFAPMLSPKSTPSPYVALFTPELLKDIEDIACPGDCNGHGICDKGQCVCQDGYYDIDCGQDIRQPPRIEGIPDLGVCDLNMRECGVTSVFGRNFIESSTLSCKLVPFEVHALEVVIRDPLIVPGEIETIVEISCNLPKARERRSVTEGVNAPIARGYNVSVSNDGSAFSEEDLLVIYDATCVSCTTVNGVVKCSKESGFCMENGICFKQGQSTNCLTCTVDNGDSSWSPSTECADPYSEPAKKLWIIGAAVGPIVGATIVALAIYCYNKKRSQFRRKKLGSINPLNDTEVASVQQSKT